MTDIVERLRNPSADNDMAALLVRQGGQMLTMKSEIERLRAALTEAADLLDGDGEYPATARRFRAILADNERL